MKYPYELAATKEVGISLWVLERFEWSWGSMSKLISRQPFVKRAHLAGKCTALVAHDRLLGGEVEKRGLPSFYGDAK